MAKVEGGLTMSNRIERNDIEFAHTIADFYSDLKAKDRVYEPPGRVELRLATMKRNSRLVEADILESERRCERRRLLDEFQYSADGTPLILNRDGSRVVIEGQAVPFGMHSNKIDGKYEKFSRGALNWDPGCKLLMGHGGPEVANTASGLRIWEEDNALKFSAVLSDTPAGRSAVNFARLSTGVSIRFMKMEQALNGGWVQIRKALLRHIAILGPPSQPAYPFTWVNVHSEPPP